MTFEDISYTPTSVTIIIEGKQYTGYKCGMEWIIYTLEAFRLHRMHQNSIKVIK